jgi:magnesium chelatase family protein
MSSRQTRQHCELSTASKTLLKAGVESLGLSARAHDKILRVARTIADLAGEPAINEEHLAEAIGYRNLDADLWV